MSAASQPFFALESLLVQRLKDVAPSSVHVLTAADLAGMAETAQHTPAWQVIYGGYRVLDSAARGANQSIEQRWFVVTAVRNAGSQLSGAAGRQEAGALVNAALYALLGWWPGAPFDRLTLGTGGAPSFRKGGLAYYPLLFLTKFAVTGESQRSTR